MLPVPAVGWSPDQRALRILDQRRLPSEEVVRDLVALEETIDAIVTLAIRGAPAIGVGAAIGLTVALTRDSDGDGARARALLEGYAERLIAARPTAVNLAWAVRRLVAHAAAHPDTALLTALALEAEAIRAEDAAMCAAIGAHGLAIVPDGAQVLTHCNAGALATAGTGTALAPVYAAKAAGRSVHVYADETRPLRQGARLTAWELSRAGIPVQVLPDGAAASLLASGAVDLVIVGADRIAANGDVANKVGTYGVALAAHAHHVPFYVAAPWSTIDPATPTGSAIVIEHRASAELGELPAGAGVWNPAFDVTPRALVTGYLTDRGFVTPPFTDMRTPS
ncbi:MAG: S-methyl-5-thioribose-1-phosphate isomerase [Gemmatimonadaceae bacterium]|nr:S-methyl-5-thioribose-1-phosphate isomerase [Gemmatimonadaceae bacterium]